MFTSCSNLSSFALERETNWKNVQTPTFICYQASASLSKTRGNMTDLCASFRWKWKSFVVSFWFCALPFPTPHEAFLSSSNKFTSRHVHAVAGRNLEQSYGAVLSKRKIRCAQNYLKVSPAFFPRHFAFERSRLCSTHILLVLLNGVHIMLSVLNTHHWAICSKRLLSMNVPVIAYTVHYASYRCWDALSCTEVCERWGSKLARSCT